MKKKLDRSSNSLRDVLFDEIEELRNGTGDPIKAMAIANLAKQITNVVKVELDYHRLAMTHNQEGKSLTLGNVSLGGNAASVAPSVTANGSG